MPRGPYQRIRVHQHAQAQPDTPEEAREDHEDEDGDEREDDEPGDATEAEEVAAEADDPAAPLPMAVAQMCAEETPRMSVEPAPAAPVSAHTAPAPSRPPLDTAFFLLCEAIAAHLDDNLTAWTHCQEIQAWMHNAGGDATGMAQKVLAWRHAVLLLEGVLGQKLTPG